MGNIALLLMLAVSTIGSSQAAESQQSPVHVAADYAVAVDYPLVKSKFAVFNSGWVPLDRYERDIHLYDEVRPQSLRIDLGWGFMTNWPQPVAGTREDIRYDFSQVDRLTRMLNEHDVLPYWAYCYVPPPLQPEGGDFRSVPTDMALWGEILAAVTGHFLEGGDALRIGYHEIYNEPDNRDFLRASVEQYIDMYRHGATRIREVNPDAVVGGPSLAFTDAWVEPFLDAVTSENLPLDFFSYHYYPSHGKDFYPGIAKPEQGYKTVESVVQAMRASLARRPELAHVEMHLNEFNAYPIDYPRGGRQDRHFIAPELLHAIKYFLTEPDVTQVHWAQFMDTGGGNWSGMITRDGHRKAIFNAFKLYMQMPTDRRQVTLSSGDPVEALASTDGHQAGLLVWNRSDAPHEVNVSLANLPFTSDACQVYRIDEHHASYGDNPASETLAPLETAAATAPRGFTWSGALPAHGIVYLAADDGSGFTEAVDKPLARIIREHYHFPDRDSASYANFDRRTWTARLGMGPRGQAREQLALVLEDLPDEINATLETEPALALSDNNLLGLRIDYQVGEDYTRAVLFHNAPSASTSFPWGTARPHDRDIKVNLPGSINIPIKEHAPENWTGRIILTFIMHDFPPETRARFTLR